VHFLIASRAGWHDVNAHGSLHGWRVEPLAIETHGASPDLRTALDAVQVNPACQVLSGSAGDLLANQIADRSRQGSFHISFNAQRRSGAYGTETMMTLSGRLIG
jgi:hypothetical protein